MAQTCLAVLADKVSRASTVKSAWMTVYRIRAGMVEYVRSVTQGLPSSASMFSLSFYRHTYTLHNVDLSMTIQLQCMCVLVLGDILELTVKWMLTTVSLNLVRTMGLVL